MEIGRSPAVYPGDAAAAVLARLPAAGAREPLPTEAELAALLETAFFATLTDDEGRPSLFQLTFAQPEEIDAGSDLQAPIEPRPLTVDVIRRLAPAAHTTGAAIAVASDGGALAVWGLVLSPSSDTGRTPGRGVHLVARGRGAVEISVGGQRIALYVRGNLRLYEQHIHETELVRVIETVAPRVAGVEPHAELLTILRIADANTDFDHGGTLLVVPAGPYDAIPALRPSPRYPVRRDARGFLADALSTHRARSGVAAQDARRAAFAAVDFDRWSEDRLLDREARRTLEDAVRLVAGFTAVDGAVVITAGLEVLAFGAMIDVVPDPAPTEVVTVDPFDPERRRRELPHAFGGARHQSAIAFCRGQTDGALAFVASHDGTLTFFIRSPDDVIALRPLDLSATR